MEEIRFLGFDEVLAIHDEQLALYGGAAGILDEGVVRSAMAAASASFGGQYFHEDVAAMAAAYLYSFSASQGFADGNKRTAANCATAFLVINGYDLNCSSEELYDVTMRVANHLMDRDGAAAWLRERIDLND
jgi:death-on-curing protein